MDRATLMTLMLLTLIGPAQARTLKVSAERGEYATLAEALKDSKPGDALALLDVGRVGMELAKDRDGYLVKRVVTGSGAQKAGIKVGEVIVKIEGATTDDLTLKDVIERLGGKSGTKVRVRIERGDSMPALVEIERSPAIYPITAEEPRFEVARKFGDLAAALELAMLEPDSNIAAQRFLAQTYASGAGFLQNFKTAAPYAKKCAEAADHDCEFLYGEMLANGLGVAKNDRDAIVWLKRAVDGGIAAARAPLSKVKTRVNQVVP